MPTVPAGVQPGDFFCTYTASEVARWISIGEWFNGDRFARTRGRMFAHSGVVVEAGPRTPIVIVEAEPGGVRQVPWHYGSGCVTVWSTGIVQAPDPSAVVDKAKSMKGIPYGWWNYPAMGALRLHLPVPLLDEYVASERSVICSELTDIAERAGGLIMIPDRTPGFVTPQEVADWLMARGAKPMSAA